MIRITRYRLARSRFATGPGPAWYWGYVVHVPGKPDSDRGRGLKDARGWAKREAKRLGLEVVEDWPKRVSQAYMDRVSAEQESIEQERRDGE